MENLGNQNRVFYYKQELASSEFNRLLSKTLPAGLYEGGSFTRLSESEISIDPFVVVIEDSNVESSDVATRIRTLEAVTFDLEADTDRPLVVARYEWEETTENYLQFVQTSEEIDDSSLTSLHSYDLVLGKVVFNDSGKIEETNSFDYTRTNYAFSNSLSSFLLPNFKVKTPIGTANKKKVYIESGKVLTAKGLVDLSGTYSDEISDTISHSRWDYIYINDEGEIRIQEGEESEYPKTKPFYSRRVLAIIKREAGRTDIKGSDISSCFSAKDAELKSTSILVNDLGTSEVFSRNENGFITIDDALRELWTKISSVEDRASDLEDSYVTKATNQTVTSTKIFEKLIQFKSQAGTALEATLDSQPITKKYYENTTSGTAAVQTGSSSSPKDQTIYGIKTFKTLPKVPTTTPTDDAEVITKKHFDDNTVKLTTSQTIAGTKTFSLLPKVPTEDPTDDAEVVSKSFLEGNAKVLRTGSSSNSESQDVYGTKTFKTLPRVPETDPVAGSEVISKTYLDGNAPILRLGTSSSSESQTVYGTKTFRTLPKFNNGTDPLTPSSSDQPIIKKYYDDNTVKLSSNQSISGTKTFSSSPSVPTSPASDSSAINKSYLNSSSSGVVHTSGTESIGGAKTFTTEVTAPSFNANSSRALKENIHESTDSALDIIGKTKIVRYSYIDDKDSYSHIGFIAEDTPEIMTGKGHKTMALSDVCGVLLKAVQELSNEIETLKKELK